MSKIKRKFMFMAMKAAAKKEGISEDLIKQRFETPINFVNSSNLDRMVDVYHRVNITKR